MPKDGGVPASIASFFVAVVSPVDNFCPFMRGMSRGFAASREHQGRPADAVISAGDGDPGPSELLPRVHEPL
jgi:hypothetical protein